MTGKLYTLLGPDRRSYLSNAPGELGGNRSTRIYGRLDCAGALRLIAKGGYVKNRVFFASGDGGEGCRSRCMPVEYREWRAATDLAAQLPARPRVPHIR